MLAPITGQWFDTANGKRWWFDSGSIAFDFAYTGGFDGPPQWERWHNPADLADWWRERFHVEVQVDPLAFRKALDLRRAIAQAVVGVVRDQHIPATDASAIDRHAAMPDLPPQIIRPLPATPSRLLATIGRSAVASLSRPDRIRTCAANDCALMYVDTSRSASRVWCSMARCGNRHKIRELRARQTSTTEGEMR